MSDVFKMVLSLSISGTLLYLLLTALQPLSKHFLSKTAQYGLYLVVIGRLLIPWAPRGTLTDHIVSHSGTQSAVQAALPPVSPTAVPLTQPASTATPAAFTTDPLAAWAQWDIWEIFALIWLVIATLLLLGKLLSYWHYSRTLRMQCSPVRDPAALHELSELQKQYGPKRPITLCTHAQLGTPTLLGFFRPTIVLPTEPIPIAELGYALHHELIHCQRGDFWYKWLVQFTLCLHWFNPFVHNLSRTIAHAGELACDEQLLRTLDASGRQAYGTTLLHALKRSQGQKMSPQSLSLTSNGKRFQERLESIVTFKQSTKTTFFLTLLLTAFVCTSAAAAGAYVPSQRPLADTLPEQTSQTPFFYTQSGYYQDGYILQLGWNIPDQHTAAYPIQTTFTPADGAPLTVYFTQESAAYAQDEQLLAALNETLSAIKKREHTEQGLLKLTAPLVVQIDGPYTQSPSVLAEQFYAENALVPFAAVYAVLVDTERTAYLQRIYQDGRVAFFGAVSEQAPTQTLNQIAHQSYQDDKVAFFSMAADSLSPDALEQFAAQSYQDGKVAFFSMTSDHLPAQSLQTYAQKAYQSENIAFFTLVCDHLSSQERAAFLNQAQKDKRVAFVSVLQAEN